MLFDSRNLSICICRGESPSREEGEDLGGGIDEGSGEQEGKKELRRKPTLAEALWNRHSVALATFALFHP